MNRDEAENEVKTLLRTVAMLLGAVAGLTAAMVGTLVLSLFVDVGLPAAFMLQLLVGAASAFLSLWRTA